LKRYVIATPDVSHHTMVAGGENIILASDGLWDVVENQVRNLSCMHLHVRLLSCFSMLLVSLP
jgi:hypothetical protein